MPAEIENPTEVENWKNTDNGFHERYGASNNLPDNWLKQSRNPGDPIQHEDPVLEPIIDQPETNFEAYEYKTDEKLQGMSEVDEILDLDLFLNAEALLPQNGEYMQAAMVIGRITDYDGNPVGTYNINPIVNTQLYDVMFPYGAIQQ